MNLITRGVIFFAGTAIESAMLAVGVMAGPRTMSESVAREGWGVRPPIPVACKRIFDKTSVMFEAKYPHRHTNNVKYLRRRP